MAPFSLRQLQHVPAHIPIAGLVVSAILSVVTTVVLVVCLVRRFILLRGRNWRSIPLVRWAIFVIYIDSLLFILTTAILTWGFGLNKTLSICRTAIYLCLTCYMSTKLIYYFLVERVHIVCSLSTPRLKSKLYCFNCFGLLVPYTIIVIFNFIYRIAYFTPGGTCIIGMELKVLMPLIIFDAAINLYLTMLFVIPLRRLYSYKASADSKLHTIAFRSFIGSCCTLASSIVNLTVLMVLRGEAAWICLMCCNADILFSVLMLHWVTSKDSLHTQIDPNFWADSANGKGPKVGRLNAYGKNAQNEKHDIWQWPRAGTTTSIHGGADPDLNAKVGGIEGGINVEVGHSVVVEKDLGTLSLGSDEKTEVNSVKSPTKSWPEIVEDDRERMEETGIVGQDGMLKFHKSTEDLVHHRPQT